MSKVPAHRRTWSRALIAACLVGTSLSPAIAQAHEGRGDLHDASRELKDPMNQAKVAATLSALSGALLSIDISPLARAMDTVDGGRWSRDLPPDATLGDVAGHDARDLPYDIARKTPEAMGRMAGMLGAIDEMRPQLKAMKRQLKDTLRHQGLTGN